MQSTRFTRLWAFLRAHRTPVLALATIAALYDVVTFTDLDRPLLRAFGVGPEVRLERAIATLGPPGLVTPRVHLNGRTARVILVVHEALIWRIADLEERERVKVYRDLGEEPTYAMSRAWRDQAAARLAGAVKAQAEATALALGRAGFRPDIRGEWQ